MNTTAFGGTLFRGIIATTVAGLACAAAAAPVHARGAAPTGTSARAHAPGAAPAASRATPATASPAAPSAAPRAGDLYVQDTVERGRIHRLRLVSRSTGRVVRTLDSVDVGTAEGAGAGFADATVAPDGTVWAVAWDRRLPRSYQTMLRHYTSKGARDVRPYVTSVHVSPDGKTLATTLVSPASRRDRRGSESLDLMTSAGIITKELAVARFPVGSGGEPLYEAGGLRVAGWLGRDRLVVLSGCCDEGAVSLVSTARPAPTERWATFHGDGSTVAVGTRGATEVVVARNHVIGDGVHTPMEATGVDVYAITARRPAGTLLAMIPAKGASPWDLRDAIARRTKVTPLIVSPTRFPYRGPGAPVLAWV